MLVNNFIFMSNQKPTKILYNKEINKVEYFYDPIDPSILKEISEYRLNICKHCVNLIYKKDILICKICGCGLLHKSTVEYTLDDDKKAIGNVLHNGEISYVCKIKKW